MAMASSTETRLRVIALYKELHRLGRDYPDLAYNFHKKLRGLFESASHIYPMLHRELVLVLFVYDQVFVFLENRNLTDPEEIEKAIKMGEYIRNETLALYSLRKYRHLKRMYPDASPSDPTP